jgi:hypothetical protein
MTHLDESTVTVPTSEFFAGGTVSSTDSDDRTSALTGVDRMDYFYFYSPNCFVNEILTAPVTWDTLNSFLPIFELLGPKFVLDQNAYVSSKPNTHMSS